MERLLPGRVFFTRVEVRDVLSHPERVAVQFDSLTSHAEGLAICVINDLANVNNGVIGRD